MKKQAKIIMLANQKGGVGKTTTTGAFGAGLAKRMFKVLLIDTPPALGILTINAFAGAHEVIVPTTASMFAASGITQLAAAMNAVKSIITPA